jgi:hypothetical protein
MVNAEAQPRVNDVHSRLPEAAARRRLWCSILLTALAIAASAGCTSATTEESSPSSSTPTTTAESQENPEDAAKRAAIDAFTDLLRVRDAAAQEPLAQDWEPEIRKHAADPAAYAAVQSIRTYATLGVHQVGDSKVDLQVTGVDLNAAAGPTVSISGCYDSQASQVVRTDTNEPVESGTPPRFTWLISVVQYKAEPGEPWLVTDLEPRADQPC